jgi:hypothetical protein
MKKFVVTIDVKFNVAYTIYAIAFLMAILLHQ